MRPIDIARTITETRTCHLVRPRKDNPGEYDAKPYSTGNKHGWFYWDLFSASVVVSVYDALSPAARAKYDQYPPLGMVSIAMKLLK